jgi:hypothetical protein
MSVLGIVFFAKKPCKEFAKNELGKMGNNGGEIKP